MRCVTSNIREPSKNQLIKNQSVLTNKGIQHTKVCIIYVYYEKKNRHKNQTNLAFFIKYGLDKSRWKDIDTTTLFVINGRQCEVSIPERDDIIVWRRDYQGEYDIGSYRLGIEYVEKKKYNKKFHNIFTHLFIMNAGVFGPIYGCKPKTHWLDPFLNKMEKENSAICSPVINFLKSNDAGGPGPRCQSYCSLIKINKNIYNLLLHTKISNLSEGTNNKNFPLHSHFVLTHHKKHHNIILIGEYGMTRILLNNGYNISCLIYDNIDYHNKHLVSKYSHRLDRFDDYKHEYFNKAIFIKNNWLVNDTIKDSLPVMYNETINYLNQKINYKNIYNNLKIEYDYGFLKIHPNITFTKNSKKLVTKNKIDSYKTFGVSEEIVLWPKQNNNNKSLVIYCHYDKDNILKDYVIHSLKTLIILGYDIIFCTANSDIKNVDLPFTIHYYKNSKKDDYLFMFWDVLKNIEIKKYTWVTLLNDSIILPIHGIDNMKKTITKYRENNEIWGLYLFNKSKMSICSGHIEFNISCILKIKNIQNTNLKSTNTIIEKIVEHISLEDYKYDGVVNYTQLSIPVNHSDIEIETVNIDKYITNQDVFGIKLSNDIVNNKFDNHYLNYLMRFFKIQVIKFIYNYYILYK